MSMTISSLTDYYRVFASPVSVTQSNPVEKLVYGNAAGRLYSQTLGKRAQSSISSYLTSLNRNASGLKDASKQPVKESSMAKNNDSSINNISAKPAAGSDAKAGIKKMLEAYNKAVKSLNTFEDSYGSASKLKKELDELITKRADSLKNAGITKKQDGTLEIDEDKLDKAIENDSSGEVKVFTGKGSLSDDLYTKASEILSSPLSYIGAEIQRDGYNGFYSRQPASTNSWFQNYSRGMVLNLLL